MKNISELYETLDKIKGAKSDAALKTHLTRFLKMSASMTLKAGYNVSFNAGDVNLSGQGVQGESSVARLKEILKTAQKPTAKKEKGRN